MKLTRLLFGLLITAMLGSSIVLAFAATGKYDVQLQIPIGTQEKIEACKEVPDPTPTDPNNKALTCTGLSNYIVQIYEWLVRAAAILAAAMITWGGFQWLSAAGESKRVEEGKKIMHNALIGLVLALGSYTLLWAINPDLVGVGKLDLSLIKPKQQAAVSSTPVSLGPECGPYAYGLRCPDATKYCSWGSCVPKLADGAGVCKDEYYPTVAHPRIHTANDMCLSNYCDTTTQQCMRDPAHDIGVCCFNEKLSADPNLQARFTAGGTRAACNGAGFYASGSIHTVTQFCSGKTTEAACGTKVPSTDGGTKWLPSLTPGVCGP